MRQSDLRPIESFRGLMGSWQFAGESGRHLAVLERDGPGRRLRVFTLTGGRWEQTGQLPAEQVAAVAVDGYRAGSTVYVCAEVNDLIPLRLWSIDYAALAAPGSTGTLRRGERLELSAAEAAKVGVPSSRQWHAALPVPAWLFSPRFVRGAVRSPVIVASTADGQVAFLGPGDAKKELRVPQIRNAIEPRAVAFGKDVVVAFLRPPGQGVYPFWLLPRYTPSAGSPTGDLVVKDAADPEVNLSAVLQLGPVTGLHMAAAEDGAPWLFALIDVPTGTDVVAIERRGQQWVVRGRQTFNVELAGVSAEAGVNQWHMVYATSPSTDGTTLYAQDWIIAS